METRYSSAPGRPEAPQAATTVVRGRIEDSACTVAGGLLVVAGAILSLMFPATGAHRVGPAAATAAMIFGLVLAALGAALRSVHREAAPATAATALGLSALGAVAFALTGLRLFGASALAHTVYTFAAFILLPWQARAEVSALAQHTPYLGTVVAVAGSLVAVVGAFSARCHRPR
ncbi:MAG TPA: hypothetical protein VN847_07720 [Streptosporangiaceae bacterium]|nr:hypothetical protein [Streptosporangiaceae bacterium]